MSENDLSQNFPGHFNPVTVTASESIGTFFLGLMALVLLIALLRTQRRNVALEREVARRQYAGD